ncbi:Chromatin modification-related YNG2, partial [Paramuricea clavata]
MDVIASAFLDDNGEYKEIECVRVDGATDEGRSHAEVQFIWCERHVNRKTKVTLVTTRCIGDSYLNRVELQNGCLSRGHSNTFIPSTLHGVPYSENGEFDKKLHGKNMSAALDQYISRVDGTPCMKTVIHLARGAENHDFVSRRSKLMVFIKGNKTEKQNLQKEDPTLFKYFSEIWKVRDNHMDKSLPEKYVFMLRCCGKSTFNPTSTVSGSFMICCDQCGQWYHGKCINVTEVEAETIETYVFNSCKEH